MTIEDRARALALDDWGAEAADDIEECFSAQEHDSDCDGLPFECARCTANMFRQMAEYGAGVI